MIHSLEVGAVVFLKFLVSTQLEDSAGELWAPSNTLFAFFYLGDHEWRHMFMDVINSHEHEGPLLLSKNSPNVVLL